MWPKVDEISLSQHTKDLYDVFKDKISFQIKHGVFRSKVNKLVARRKDKLIHYYIFLFQNIFQGFFNINQIFICSVDCVIIKARESEKTIFEVLKWYDRINSFLMDYISFSIRVRNFRTFSSITKILIPFDTLSFFKFLKLGVRRWYVLSLHYQHQEFVTIYRRMW